ncbi:MAG: hypothetical protein GX957_10845, partial [Clostridiaceae bacterium]|nr:hypothetical protein [Clostridiaceae bacterium]
MIKPKIHELAKELNVTSKRLMEKLNEINIYPKSHMTALEPDEVERLYKHIGVVRNDKNTGKESQTNAESKTEQPNVSARRNAPRIIRKTRVIIHDDIPLEEEKPKKTRRPLVRTSDNNDGLMAGFTRTESDLPITNVRKRSKSKSKEKEEKKDPISVLKAEADRSQDKSVKPVDDIIGIKRVIKRSDLTQEDLEGSKDIKQIKEQEVMQEVSIKTEKNGTEVEKDNAANKTADKDIVSDKKEEKIEDKQAASTTTEKEVVAPEAEAEKSAKETDKQSASKDVEEPEKKSFAKKPEITAQPTDSDKKEQGTRKTVSRADSAKEIKQAGSNLKAQDAPQQKKRGTSSSRQSTGRDNKEEHPQRPRGRQGSGRAFDRRSDFKRDDRSNTSSKNLVIPKATVLPGTAEEKVSTRGERRTFQVVDKQKLEKKEEKRSGVRSNAYQKGSRIKKKLDTVIGHTANVKDMMSDDFVIDTFYDDAEEVKNVKRAERRLKKNKQKEKHIPPKAVLTDITIGETITVRELAEALKKTAAEVIKRLFLMGVVATQNQEIDFDTASIVADEFNVKVHKEVVVTQEDILFDDSEDAP